MLSKFLRPTYRYSRILLVTVSSHQNVGCRRVLSYIPRSQYDTPWANRLNIGYVLRVYWETIPLFTVTFIAVACMFIAIMWAIQNKVDIVFSTHSRNNISRTMCLRNPTVHKMVIVNQRYPPWPEMADVLDKMKDAERRAQMRFDNCPGPK